MRSSCAPPPPGWAFSWVSRPVFALPAWSTSPAPIHPPGTPLPSHPLRRRRGRGLAGRGRRSRRSAVRMRPREGAPASSVGAGGPPGRDARWAEVVPVFRATHEALLSSGRDGQCTQARTPPRSGNRAMSARVLWRAFPSWGLPAGTPAASCESADGTAGGGVPFSSSANQSRAAPALNPRDRMAMETFRTLPIERRRVVRDLIQMLASKK